MKKMQNLMVSVAAVAFLASSGYAAEVANKFPTSQGGQSHEMLQFMGLKVKRITASASATALVSGPGFLDAICPFGGTLGKYSMAYDTYTNPTAVADDNYTLAISPKVYTTNDTTSAQHGQMGCWVPPAPIKFITGMYGKQDSAGHSTQYFVHCSDGSNPCAP